MAKAYKLPSGSWRVRVYQGPDAIPKYASVTADTRKQAEMDAALLSYKKDKPAARKLSVGDAIDRYIQAKEPVLSPKTIREYKSIRRQAFPDIMLIDINELTHEAFQIAVNGYAAGHSPKSVKNAAGLITATFSLFAPEKRLRPTLPRAVKTDLSIPTDEQLKQLIKGADAGLHTAILLASALGLRRSEICALTWDDIDMKKGFVSVNKAVVYTQDNLWAVKATKTASSTRRLDLPPFILKHLQGLPQDQERPVPCTPDNITYRFVKLRDKLGLTIRFHDLRHYYASLLLALGVPDKYAMARMGHASPNMLRSVYQHLMQDKKDEVSASINAALTERFK